MLALLLYGVVLADPLPVEGWDGQVAWEELPQPVVGGTQVAAGDWDDAAAIVFYGSWVGCTGTLIAPDVVLTAGHCVGGISHVILGSKDWDSNEGEVIAVDRTYEYPDSWWTYDAAVLKLAEPSSYPPRAIGMDCITDHWLEDGAEVVVVGYAHLYASVGP